MTDTELPAVRNIGEALCLKYQYDFERALGYELISGHLNFSSFLMAVKEDVLNSPKLAEAFQRSPGTAISALLLSAQCKLLPGSKYGEFYLIPRNRKGFPEVSPLIGYKGLARMAQRHPRVHSVESFLVYEGEQFDYNPGTGVCHHKWDPKCDRSDDKIIAAYAKVIITEPTTSHVVDKPIIWPMSIDEILKRRNVSEAWKWAEKSKKYDSPWHVWFPEMVSKTVVRAILSSGRVPRDMGVGGVLTQDDQADVRQEKATVPHITQGSRVRASLGLDQPEAEPFGLAEEAIAHIQQAKDLNALEALAPRWQHFTDMDAEMIATAYEARIKDFA